MRHSIFSINRFFPSFLLLAKKPAGTGPTPEKGPLKNKISQSEKLPELYPPEKVDLHFSNTCYHLNGHIWLKAYATTSGKRRNSDPSLSSFPSSESGDPTGRSSRATRQPGGSTGELSPSTQHLILKLFSEKRE